MSRTPARKSVKTEERAPAIKARSASSKRGSAGLLTSAQAAINDQVSQDAAAKPKRPVPATRADKKGLVLYVDKALLAQLRRLAALNDTTVQALGQTALNMLFEEHGLATFPVAPARR